MPHTPQMYSYSMLKYHKNNQYISTDYFLYTVLFAKVWFIQKISSAAAILHTKILIFEVATYFSLESCYLPFESSALLRQSAVPSASVISSYDRIVADDRLIALPSAPI